ncbi:MAG: putative Ig domain-containing protein, partial [Chloroflexi bacterium]|nr:putative Ig domain-containing protein [Chloroflexota bacterium]
STYGQSVTFTATVTTGATGQVTFLIDGTPQATSVTLVGGIATLTLANLTVGNHTINAQYLGDANYTGSTGAQASTLVVMAPTITLTPTTVPNGQVGTAYSQNVTATGGTAPYTYTVTLGTLPAGLTLASNGTLSGNPTAFGTFNFTVTATDANGFTGAQAYTLMIAPLISLTPTTLPGGIAGTAYSQNLTATGGTAPYTYTITLGTLPTGLTLASNGTLSGNPTVAGTFNFTVTATDANGFTGAQAYSLVLASPTLTLLPTGLPNATIGTPYSQALAGSGGVGPYTFALANGSTLPTGLSLSSSGIISGTPTLLGPATVNVTVTDANGFSATFAVSLAVVNTTITLSPTTLPVLVVSQPYSQTLTALGGTAPYTYTVTTGTLPVGLNLASDGTLSGTPTVVGISTFTVTATDLYASTGTQVYTLIVMAIPGTNGTITLTPVTLPGGIVNQGYSQNVTATGGTAPYTYTVATGALPTGLTLNNGTISGTPTVAGTFNFTITATDSNGGVGSQAYTITIVSTGGFNSNPIPGSTINFGQTRVKQPLTALLTVIGTNINLIISNPVISGANASDFTILSPTFPLNIAQGGASQSIKLQCTPAANGTRTATLTFSTNDPNLPTVSYTLICTATEKEKVPADLSGQLKVTPDRLISSDPTTNVIFTLSVMNYNHGRADAVRVIFPLDPHLTLGYPTFSDSRMWISEIVKDGSQPYLKIELPKMEYNQVFSATLVFHPAANAKTDETFVVRYSVGWDDELHAGNQSLSNVARLKLTERESKDDTKGEVQRLPQDNTSIAAGETLTLNLDSFASFELVRFWYTDENGNSVLLGIQKTDAEGKLTLEFVTKNVKPGIYVVNGQGGRSQVTYSGVITLT